MLSKFIDKAKPRLSLKRGNQKTGSTSSNESHKFPTTSITNHIFGYREDKYVESLPGKPIDRLTAYANLLQDT